MIDEDKAKRERNHLACVDEKENCGENPMKTSERQINHGQSRVANLGASSLPSAFGFTLIELLVVIAIIGILAGLTVALSGKVAYAKKIKPTQTLLAELELTIEGYKKDRGSYPPNSDRNGRVNVQGTSTKIVVPAMNPLFYELTGTVFNPQTKSYTSSQGGAGLFPQQCRSFFGVKGFSNVTQNPGKTKSFIELESDKFDPISENPAVNLLLAPVNWPLKTNDDSLERYRPIQSEETINGTKIRTLNPWQYRAPGIKNSKSFDLWADVLVGKKVYRIGNWGKREPEVVN